MSSIGSEDLRKVEIVIRGCPFVSKSPTGLPHSNVAEGAREGFTSVFEASPVWTPESWVMLVIVFWEMKLFGFKGSEKKSSSGAGGFPGCEAERRGREPSFSCCVAFVFEFEVAVVEEVAGGDESFALGIDRRGAWLKGRRREKERWVPPLVPAAAVAAGIAKEREKKEKTIGASGS